MKKFILYGTLFSFVMALNAMEETKATALTFTKAEKGEDLNPYKEILLHVYPEYTTNPAIKDHLKEALSRSFAVLTSWIGQEGKVFIKVQDGHTPIGFLTLESLKEDNSEIAFHQSPLLPHYLHRIDEYFAYVKKEFPHAKFAYTACSDKLSKMQHLIRRLGFVEDPNYFPSKDLVPNPVGFMGYKKALEK